jgi:hypothetical protein
MTGLTNAHSQEFKEKSVIQEILSLLAVGIEKRGHDEKRYYKFSD